MTQQPSSRRQALEARLGERVAGRFRLARVIGAGGMGWVYLAVQEPLGRPVALKVLVPEREDASFRQRFFLEASVAARLSSPHIVTIHDYGETEQGELYIAMEFVPGVSLSTVLKREGAFTPERICRLMRQVCKGLSVAHDAGVVHRDLKPSNVMLMTDRDGDEIVKVLDFGLVKDFSGMAEGDLTGAGMVLGSPRYMAPEQIRRGPLDPRTDIYAAGVLIYRLLTGAAPFQAGTMVEVMNLHLNAAPPPIDQFLPEPNGIQRQLEVVAMRCLQKRPEHRYPTMDALKDAVRAVERQIPPDPLAPRRRRSSTDSSAGPSDSFRSVSPSASGSAPSVPSSSPDHSPAAPALDDLPTVSHSAFMSVPGLEVVPSVSVGEGPGTGDGRPSTPSYSSVMPDPSPASGMSGPLGSGSVPLVPADYTGSDPRAALVASVGPRTPADGSYPSYEPYAGASLPPTRSDYGPVAPRPMTPPAGEPSESASSFSPPLVVAAARHPTRPTPSYPRPASTAVADSGPSWWRWLAAGVLFATVGVTAFILTRASQSAPPPAPAAESSTPRAPASASTPARAERSAFMEPDGVARQAPRPPAPAVRAPVSPSTPSARPGASTPPPTAIRRQTLVLRSRPPGATVVLGRRRLGDTPLEITVAGADRARTLVFELDGYQPVEKDFTGEQSKVVLDVALKKMRRASTRVLRAAPSPPADRRSPARTAPDRRAAPKSESAPSMSEPADPPPSRTGLRRKLKANPYD